MECGNGGTYSQIIAPAQYNKILRYHDQIPEADRATIWAIRKRVEELLAEGRKDKIIILEAGAGPARLLLPVANMLREAHLNAHVQLIGLDHDWEFIRYGREVLLHSGHNDVEIRPADLTDPNGIGVAKAEVIYSQGTHHHVEKGAPMVRYLRNLRLALSREGVMYVGDEFLPYYKDEAERRLRAMIWYSFIVARALFRADRFRQSDPERARIYSLLALEEMKTSLDDTLPTEFIKQSAQIAAVGKHAREIYRATREGNTAKETGLAKRALAEIDGLSGYETQGDPSIDISRGDYKIDHHHFSEEMAAAGFRITGVRTFGDNLNVGGMGVYELRRAR